MERIRKVLRSFLSLFLSGHNGVKLKKSKQTIIFLHDALIDGNQNLLRVSLWLTIITNSTTVSRVIRRFLFV